jgi:hypothetical protein
MNINRQELDNHIEFEPDTLIAAFIGEQQFNTYIMWAMLLHLTSTGTRELSSNVIRASTKHLFKWLQSIGYINNQYAIDVYGGNVSFSATIILLVPIVTQPLFDDQIMSISSVFIYPCIGILELSCVKQCESKALEWKILCHTPVQVIKMKEMHFY